MVLTCRITIVEGDSKLWQGLDRYLQGDKKLKCNMLGSKRSEGKVS